LSFPADEVLVGVEPDVVFVEVTSVVVFVVVAAVPGRH
jgi:hypothetical protein